MDEEIQFVFHGLMKSLDAFDNNSLNCIPMIHYSLFSLCPVCRMQHKNDQQTRLIHRTCITVACILAQKCLKSDSFLKYIEFEWVAEQNSPIE